MTESSVALQSIEGAHKVTAYVHDMELVRLSISGPLFCVVEVEVEYARRDVRWRVGDVFVCGYFDEVLPVREDPKQVDVWQPPDMLRVALLHSGFYPQWLSEFIAKHKPGVS